MGKNVETTTGYFNQPIFRQKVAGRRSGIPLGGPSVSRMTMA